MLNLFGQYVDINGQIYEITSPNNNNSQCISLKNIITNKFLRHFYGHVFDTDSCFYNKSTFNNDSSYFINKKDKDISFICSNKGLNHLYISLIDNELKIDNKNYINNFKIIDKSTFNLDTYKKLYEHPKKIGYLTWLITNYGSVLQSLAVNKTVEKLGYDCDILGCGYAVNNRYPDDKIDKTSKEYEIKIMNFNFEKFIMQHFHLSEEFSNINDELSLKQKIALAKYDIFLCGGDCIWQPGEYFSKKLYLDFAPSEKKVAYGPSIGWYKIPQKYVKNIPKWKNLISNFEYVSFREEYTANAVSEIIHRQIPTVIDSTFLLSKDEWSELCKKPLLSDDIKKIVSSGKKFILVYMLDSYPEYKKYIDEFSKRHDMSVIWLTGRPWINREHMQNCAYTDPAGLLFLLKNASYIFSDGFHGSCFSLIFKKPFIACARPYSWQQNDPRVEDLLNRLGAGDRIICNPSKILEMPLEINYEYLNKNIDKEVKFSLEYLSKALINIVSGKRNPEKPINISTQKEKINLALTNDSNIKKVPNNIHEKCTGCAACMNICPTNSIYMHSDCNGFLYPKIDDKKCINCSRCYDSCPVLHKKYFYREKSTIAYAAWYNNFTSIMKSSSGGMFSVFANDFFDNNGIVYGVTMDENFIAKFVSAKNMEEIKPLQGSKYVQAETNFIFNDIKKHIKKYPILFTGTSCQVAGLYAVLGDDYENLITVDFICGGVPSPLVIKKYIDWREIEQNSKLKKFIFRSKYKHGWSHTVELVFENGKKFPFYMWNDEFGILYNEKIIQRPSCFQCKYRGIENRIADITFGDFWDIGKNGIPFNHSTSQGVSVVLPNSIKGNVFWQKISSRLDVFTEKRPLEDLYPSNGGLLKSPHKPEGYDIFFDLIRENDFHKAFSIYFGNDTIRMKNELK